MNRLLLFLLHCFPFVSFGQVVDSITIRQVDSLIQISRTLTEQNDFDKALEVGSEAEKIALEKLGRETVAYSNCCHNHGKVLLSKGDYAGAEEWCLESVSILGKAVGRQHPTFAAGLNRLAILYHGLADYEKAEPLYLEAIDIWVKSLGKESPNYASGLNNLAVLYEETGNYEKAEPLHLESIALCEKLLGKEDPDYASSLNNLAVLYFEMRNYEKAEPLYQEAKDIWAKTLGKEHPDYASCLNNLANLYREMGNYEKAKPLYLESKAIREKSLGKEHPEYVLSLSNLAGIYTETGSYDKAEALCLEAKAIMEKTFGTEAPDYARNLDNLAALHMARSEYSEAESVFKETLSIREKTQGKMHPDYALSLASLATMYWKSGNYKNAEQCLLESKTILEKTLGKDNSDYEASLNDLALLYWETGKSRAAQQNFQEAGDIQKSLLLKATRHLSESELLSYTQLFNRNLDHHFSFAQSLTDPASGFWGACYDNVLFHKGFLLNASLQIRNQVASDPALAEQFNSLKSYYRRLAAENTLPNFERDSAGIAELEAIANDLEKNLARTVTGYGEAMRQVKWQEVQAALKAGEAVVEFVTYRFYQKKETDSTMYAALVLLPGKNEPQFIPLFEEKQLDSLLRTSGERKADYVNSLYTIAERGVKPLGKPQKSLYELLWQPLEKELNSPSGVGGAGVKTIYFSPSGLLHRLNLGAIPISEEETLSDRFQLLELGSTRQLVVPHSFVNSEKTALLFGGVQYEMDSTAIAQANQNLSTDELLANRSRGGLPFANTDSALRGGTWNYLKWTEKEVAGLEQILKNAGIKASIRKGFASTEESFKVIGTGGNSPRILHIATHGFFFPDPKEAVSSRQSAVGSEPVFKISDHPMIRSGLILAGGNHAWKTGKPLKPGMDDGILTAYEISQMNLAGTELVVLSACETGLGDIQGNEGVYGLQRAFKIAGAKYLIMSLWQVPDFQTQELMTTFYKNWLEGKMPIPDAFRSAQKEMREKYRNPYFWAGFVLVE